MQQRHAMTHMLKLCAANTCQKRDLGRVLHQIDDVIQLQQVPDFIAAVDQRNQPRANLGRHRVNGIADNVVQQLV